MEAPSAEEEEKEEEEEEEEEPIQQQSGWGGSDGWGGDEAPAKKRQRTEAEEDRLRENFGRGFQMLRRMGWACGRGLGADGGGRLRPVVVVPAAETRGIACGAEERALQQARIAAAATTSAADVQTPRRQKSERVREAQRRDRAKAKAEEKLRRHLVKRELSQAQAVASELRGTLNVAGFLDAFVWAGGDKDLIPWIRDSLLCPEPPP